MWRPTSFAGFAFLLGCSPSAPSNAPSHPAPVVASESVVAAVPSPPERGLAADCERAMIALEAGSPSNGRGVAAANVAPESPVERDAKVQIIGENLAAWRKVEPMVQTLGVHQTAVAYVDALVRQRRVLASLEFRERLLPPTIPGTPPPQPGREPPPVFYLADSERIRFNEARAEYLQFWDPLASLCSRPR